MSDKKVLAAFLVATVAVAGGSAWAASEPASPSAMPQTAAQKDFGNLSADGAKAFQDLTLTRLAIYDGKIDDAKKWIHEADTAFSKSKTDDSVFMKAENALMTPQQLAAKTGAAKTGKTTDAQNQPADEHADNVAAPVAWLPVDGAISLNEDYTMNPAKTKAVADANKSLASGDRKGAVDRLRLADVDTSVVLEVVPLDRTIADVHQATQMIDGGQYYQGSQMLRQVEMSARYDVADIIGTPKTASHPASTEPASTEPATTH